MTTSFTDWNPYELEHYGIPGMKWGVRRYMNRDGTLTAAGKARYGQSDTKRTTAGKMTRDFNWLDQSYANVEHRRKVAEGKVVREMRKANKSRSESGSEKHRAKAMKAARKASEAHAQKKKIESLQWRVIGKAAKKGYSINSEPVVRSGERGREKIARMIGIGDRSTKVDGQNVMISRRGTSSKVVNYAGAKRADVQKAKSLEERKKLANARR